MNKSTFNKKSQKAINKLPKHKTSEEEEMAILLTVIDLQYLYNKMSHYPQIQEDIKNLIYKIENL